MPQMKDPIERCGAFIEVVDAQENLYTGKCRCHSYQIDENHIGRISDSEDKPLDYCKNSVILRKDAWISVRTWIEELFVWYKMNKKSKSKKKLKKSNKKFNEINKEEFLVPAEDDQYNFEEALSHP